MSIVHEQVAVATPRDFTRALIEEVAKRHGLTAGHIVSRCRERRIVVARYEAIIAVHRARPTMSSPQLGRMFNLDHSTVLYALGRTKRRNSVLFPKEATHEQPISDPQAPGPA